MRHVLAALYSLKKTYRDEMVRNYLCICRGESRRFLGVTANASQKLCIEHGILREENGVLKVNRAIAALVLHIVIDDGQEIRFAVPSYA